MRNKLIAFGVLVAGMMSATSAQAALDTNDLVGSFTGVSSMFTENADGVISTGIGVLAVLISVSILIKLLRRFIK